MKVKEIKTSKNSFLAIKEGVKNFEICKKDQSIEVEEVIRIKKNSGEQNKNEELYMQVSYIEELEQNKEYVILALQDVPRSFGIFCSMTDEEKNTFKELVTYIHVNGLFERDEYNDCWVQLKKMLKKESLSDTDQQWYMEFWETIEIEEEKKREEEEMELEEAVMFIALEDFVGEVPFGIQTLEYKYKKGEKMMMKPNGKLAKKWVENRYIEKV